MTVIRPNGITGITSITALNDTISVYKSDGTTAGLQLDGVNFNTTGVSTVGQLNVGTGGTVITTTAGGLVGVGITTPSSILDIATSSGNLEVDALGATSTKIRHTTTGGILALEGHSGIRFDKSSADEMARFDTSGRLLVGHNDNSGLASAGGLESFNVSGNNFAATRYVNTSGGPDIWLAKSRSGTVGSFGLAQENDSLGTYGWYGSNDSAWKYAGQIRASVASGFDNTDSYCPCYMQFYTSPGGSTAPQERMRIMADGSVILGAINSSNAPADVNNRIFYYSNNNSTSAELFIDSRKSTAFISVNQTYGDTGNRGAISFYRSEVYKGQISVDTTQVYYNTTSDYRLKENVVDVTGGIDFVKQLQPRSFNFINEPSKTIMGFVAHEVQDVVPNAVSGTKDGMQIWEEGEELPDGFSVGDNKLDENGDTIPDYQCLDQAKLVPVLTAALKEAIAKIETLESKVAALESN